MRVVVVGESVAGVPAPLVAHGAAAAWRAVRAGDDVEVVPLSDGGMGLLDAVARVDDTWVVAEVAGPHGHPVDAALLLRDDTAIVEAARAAGPGLAPDGRARVSHATTHGVGELLQAAIDAGAARVLVGVAGVAALDGGAGALTGLGYRLRVADGSGLKIGGEDLHRVARAERGWAEVPDGVEVVALVDRPVPLAEAATTLPSGVTDDLGVQAVATALGVWASVADRDLAEAPRADEPGAGAGGGLAFGLAAGLGAALRPAAETLLDLVGHEGFDAADLVVVVTGDPGGAVADALAARAGARLRLCPVEASAHGGETEEEFELAAGTTDSRILAAVEASVTLIAAAR